MYRSAEENRRKRARQGNIADVDFQLTRPRMRTCASIDKKRDMQNESSVAIDYPETTYRRL